MPIPLTPTEFKLARELRRQGASWERTAKAVGRKTDFVRKSLDLEFRETRSLYSADYVRRLRLSRSSGAIGVGPACPKPHLGAQPDRPFIPADVLADKERRYLLDHSSLTAALCGDPKPGHSALDKRKPRLVVSDRD